jgi:hypothetical protein
MISDKPANVRAVLSYQPRVVTRRKWIRAFCLGLAVVIASLLAMNSRHLFSKVTVLIAQSRCMRYEDRSDAPVYVFRHDAQDLTLMLLGNSRLKALPDTSGRPYRAGRVAECWAPFCKEVGIQQWYAPAGTLFLGRRTSACGKIRLVAVHITVQSTKGLNIAFETHVVTPAGLLTAVGCVQRTDGPGESDDIRDSSGVNSVLFWELDGLRIYPGRADPRDESAFEARVTIGPLEDGLVGRLQDDGTITLRSKGLSTAALKRVWGISQ